MVSDSVTASIPFAPKDFGRKKRANRSAKLKQCKLDARREQWLSQGVAKNKVLKEEPAGPRGLAPPSEKHERKNLLEKLETRRRDEDENGSMHHDFDSDSPTNSPTGSSVLSGSVSGVNFTGSSSSSSSSSSSVGCYSGSITEDEDNCLDDWEAVADALAADDENKQENSDHDHPSLESGFELSQEHEPALQLDSNCRTSNRSAPNSAPIRVAPAFGRAWRADDECRPQSLPNLSKQQSLPNRDRHRRQGDFHWDYTGVGAMNASTFCPLCTEDLDCTDASFLPCSCRFQVCLFCYKKVLELDGRCPNCRKLYEHVPVEVEASVHGSSLTLKLPRSYSMISRS